MVRRAQITDLNAVYSLTKDFATSFVTDENAFRASFTAILEEDATYFAVAESQGEIIGYVLAFSHNTLYANGPVAWVEEIMVSAEHRKQGIGRALMNEAEEWAAQRGCKLIALATRRAASFYEVLRYEASAAYYRKLI